MSSCIGRFATYFFKEPFAELKSKQHEGENKIWRPVFLFVLALSLFGLLFLAKDAGISGDEFFHVHHSQDVFNYYKTFGEDKTAATPTESNNLPYYSQSPDTFIHLLINTFCMEYYMPCSLQYLGVDRNTLCRAFGSQNWRLEGGSSHLCAAVSFSEIFGTLVQQSQRHTFCLRLHNVHILYCEVFGRFAEDKNLDCHNVGSFHRFCDLNPRWRFANGRLLRAFCHCVLHLQAKEFETCLF